jgi:hypothetical protein
MAYLYLLMVVWVVLLVFWSANPPASWWSSCGQWRLLPFACYYRLSYVSSSFLSLIFLCGMMPFFVVGVLPTLSELLLCKLYILLCFYMFMRMHVCLSLSSCLLYKTGLAIALSLAMNINCKRRLYFLKLLIYIWWTQADSWGIWYYSNVCSVRISRNAG